MTEPDKQPSPDFMPAVQAVTDAYADVVNYNQRFSGVGSVINDRLADAHVDDDGEIDEFAFDGLTFSDLTQGQAEGEMNADLNTLVNEDTFTRVGVEIMPLGTTFGAGEHTLTTTKLTPRIVNVTLYKDFLKTVPEGKVLPHEDSLLAGALESLSDIVTTCFDPESRDKMSPDSRGDVTQLGLDSLRTFTEIEDEYQRLGLDAAGIREYVGNQSDDAYDDRQVGRALRLARAYDNLEYSVKSWGQQLLPGSE